MVVVSLSFLAGAASIIAPTYASSLIPIDTYTDYKCNTASSTAANVSVPLDACITTVGMVSFHMETLPCAGGGLTKVKSWGFSDAHCVKNDFSYYDYGDGCYGAFDNSQAFGSLLLTCTDSGDINPPQVQGAPTTISVGPVVSGAASTNAPSSSDSSSSSSSSSDSFENDCHGWSCLSRAARIGIIVGLSVGVPVFVTVSVVETRRRRHTVVFEEHRPPPPPVYKMTPAVLVERVA